MQSMKSKKILLLIMLMLAVSISKAQIPIIISEDATKTEQLAAEELQRYLIQIYPSESFAISKGRSKLPTKQSIYIGTTKSQPMLLKHIDASLLETPESYVVSHLVSKGQQVGLILGADDAGLMYGVYGLLEKIGCGYQIEGDSMPEVKNSPFSFASWDLSDHPICEARISFNWFNFLSTCTSWDIEDWNKWTGQSQKLGYNNIMVHIYANNPIFTYEFNGLEKQVGYMATTRQGRDWRTQHVNDVRRMPGGWVYDGPVFGNEAALVPDAEKVAAAKNMMRSAFQHAEDRGMGLYFAIDMDTDHSNPQEMIKTLPESARFEIQAQPIKFLNQQGGEFWLANPDTPEGYRFYKTQVQSLLADYPEIDAFVLWCRIQSTPWMGLTYEDLPESWKAEYDLLVEDRPEAKEYWRSVGLFGMSKLVKSYERAVKELDQPDVKVCLGTWFTMFLDAADFFCDEHTPLVYLTGSNPAESSLSPRKPELYTKIQGIGKRRPMIPIFWTCDDNYTYYGRSYPPLKNLSDRLEGANVSGTGMIHFLTRPQGLSLVSVGDQLWQGSRNRPLRETCRETVRKICGESAAEIMGDYLFDWIYNSKNLGRETGYQFIDRALPESSLIEPGIQQRIGMLDKVLALVGDNKQASDYVNYYKGLEKFILDMHRTEANKRQALKYIGQGKLEDARRAIAKCDPVKVLEDFARFSSLGEMSPGEKGILVTMNTRWRPWYDQIRQALRMAPVRYNFGPTQHETIAHELGWLTFYLNADHSIWQTFGEKETGAGAYELPERSKVIFGEDLPENWKEICRSGIELDKPVTLQIQPIMGWEPKVSTPANILQPGKYHLNLLFDNSKVSKNKSAVVDVQIEAKAQKKGIYMFQPVSAQYLRLQCRGSNVTDWNSIWEFDCAALDRSKNSAKASASTSGYSATYAVDGNPKTRWAIQGRKHWIQFNLKEDVSFDSMKIGWYEVSTRMYDFDILVSADGQQWSKIDVLEEASSETTDRVDIFKYAGDWSRVANIVYPVKLNGSGVLEVTLSPVSGTPRICGAVLTPVGMKSAIKAKGDSGDAIIQMADDASNSVQKSTVAWKDSETFLNAIKLIESGQQEEAAQYISPLWVEKHAELIVNSKPGPLLSGQWGFSRAKRDKVYLFIRNWQPGHLMQLPNTELAITKDSCRSLTGGKVKLKWAIGTEIFMDRSERDPVATVIEYTVEGDAEKLHKVSVPDWRDQELNAPGEAVKAWREMRFGLFVHWGPCSVAGTEIGWSRRGSKMGRLRYYGSGVNGVYKADPVYDNLYKQFNPINFDGDAWAKMAKDAGIKYIVMIIKHHDGFCMYDSKVTDYDIMATPYGKDITKELAAACHRQGLKLGFYYSPRDWYHTDFGREATQDKYNEFYLEQLRELATNYGKVDIFWYDCLDSPQYLWKDVPEQSTRMLRRLQPGIILNDRGGLRGDFDTPEQSIGAFERERPWETCATIGSGWSWNAKTSEGTKSLRQCLHMLINTAGRDGNLLLNVAPRADGTFEPVQAKRLAGIGQWMKKYGHTIYGTRGGPILPSKGFVSTCKGDKVYLHLMNSQQSLLLPDLGCKVLSANCLNGGKAVLEMQEDCHKLTLEEAPEDEIDLIVELELDADTEAITPRELSK